MGEAAIRNSPHAFVLKESMTEEERKELYRTRIDESFKPYTVIDVLTKVYHRSFEEDLKSYIGKHPQLFRKAEAAVDRAVSNVWVNGCRVVRPETIFNQPLWDFLVDILVEARIRLEEVVPGHNNTKKGYNVKRLVRLRYCFDLRACHLSCRFEKAVTEEGGSLLKRPYAIPADKYLLPVLKGEDYAGLAEFIWKAYYPEAYGKNIPVDPAVWAERMGSRIRYGVFPEDGILGEYFFGFGTAETIDPETGEAREEDIDPGTIVVDHKIAGTPGCLNSTLAHECAHKYFATPYFMLQKTHGHEYCSYMCKRGKMQDPAEVHDRWNPVDIMEMHANKFPGYLLIQEKAGKKHAEMLLESYGGGRSLENMRRLVNDMAEYYGTTKTMARTRMVEFGYQEARGIMQSADGALIPPYVSDLKENETYTVNEADGLKEYVRNEEFRRVINSGRYLYVEGHYCLNSGKYVVIDQAGLYHLTYYAREHMAECCLIFRRVYENIAARALNGILRKGAGRGRRDIRYAGPNGESPVTEEGKKLRAMIEQQMSESGVFQMPFTQMTVELMKQKNMTVQKLADESGLSEETIKNMRNDPERIFSIREIAAVCVALHLSPTTSELYIKTSPAKFLSGTDMMLYQYALHQWYMLPIEVVNRRLVEAGAKPLTNLVEGYDENGVKMA